MLVGSWYEGDAMNIGKGKLPVLPVTQIIKMILLSVFLLIGIFVLNQFKLSHYFPIKTVRIYGVKHVDQQEVQHLVYPFVNHGFFSVHVEHIRDRLLQMPWVANIFVRRYWPDQIEVTVVEKNALARWKDASLLSDSGELFTPPIQSYPEDLPTFVGPNGKQVVMLKYYQEINRILTPLRAKISYLELTPYLTWKVALNNGVTLRVGHKDILTRLDHFVKVYPKIVGYPARDVDYVDLRYPNGMAVRFRAKIKT